MSEREDTYPVIWDRDEGRFVWQGLLYGDEILKQWEALGLDRDKEHQYIYEDSGGLWVEAFDHPGRDHLLRFDPNFPFPCLCYCLMCGERDLDPRQAKESDSPQN